MSRARAVLLGGVCVATVAGTFGGGLAPRTVAADGTPSVTSVTPYDGPSGGGTPIVIAGSLFTGATDVLLGGSDLTPCPATPSCFTFVDDSKIDVVTPPATAGTFDVQVITSGGTSLTKSGRSVHVPRCTDCHERRHSAE